MRVQDVQRGAVEGIDEFATDVESALEQDDSEGDGHGGCLTTSDLARQF